MSENIKDFFKPLHFEVETSCPNISRAIVRAAQKELSEFVEKFQKANWEEVRALPRWDIRRQQG